MVPCTAQSSGRFSKGATIFSTTTYTGLPHASCRRRKYSFGVSESRLGQPDVGLMGLEENVAAARTIAACSNLLLLADASGQRSFQAQSSAFQAGLLERMGRKEEAVADYRRALARDPAMQRSQDALRRLGATP